LQSFEIELWVTVVIYFNVIKNNSSVHEKLLHARNAGTFYEQNYTTLLQQVTHSVPRIKGVNISKFFKIKYQQWKSE